MATMAQTYSYSLPNSAGASQTLRDLQMKSAGGLSGLMSQDTSAQRAGIEKALYDSAAEGINTAADRNRMQMLEGTFARGVGPSSITVELAGRAQQEQSDALARAAREAYTGAGAEQRADLASQQGLYNTGFAAALAGLQGEANVNLTDLARQQQGDQFNRNLEFQGSENAANRAQQGDQFSRNLGLQYDQLAQQNSQFNTNLGWQSGENALNRQFTSGENAANRNFTGEQNDLNRQLQQLMQQAGFDFTGAQNQANRALAQTQQQNQQTWQGSENQAQRALTQYLAQTGQDFTGTQNQATRDQQMAMLLLQLANSQDIASGNALAGGLGAGIGGIGALLGPLLAQLLGGSNS